jgi:hypothetical protein
MFTALCNAPFAFQKEGSAREEMVQNNLLGTGRRPGGQLWEIQKVGDCH